MLVVASEACPRFACATSIGTVPVLIVWLACVWRLCLPRHSRHYLPFPTMSSDLDEISGSFEKIGGRLTYHPT